MHDDVSFASRLRGICQCLLGATIMPAHVIAQVTAKCHSAAVAAAPYRQGW